MSVDAGGGVFTDDEFANPEWKKAKVTLEEEVIAQNEIKNVASLPLMKAEVHDVVIHDLAWTPPLCINDKSEEKNDPDPKLTHHVDEEHDEDDPSWTPPLHIDDDSDT